MSGSKLRQSIRQRQNEIYTLKASLVLVSLVLFYFQGVSSVSTVTVWAKVEIKCLIVDDLPDAMSLSNRAT